MGKNTMLEILMSEAVAGVEEVKGSESNPRIMEYLDTTTIKATDDITPWCSACLNWVAIQAGYTGTNSAASATWRSWGAELKKPEYGCVIGFVRKDGSGHVGLYMDEDDSTYTILGGNQADKIKKSRFKKSTSDRDWYFRKPKTMLNSKAVGSAGAGAATATYIGLDEVIAKLTESNQKIQELQAQIKDIKEPTVLSYADQAAPYLIIALFGFLMYDRVKGFIKKYGH